VLYRGRHALWSSLTLSRGAFAQMQRDGNLVVLNRARRALWASGTGGHPGAHLVVQDDSNLVIYARSGRALWDRHIYLAVVPGGYRLKPGMAAVSLSRKFQLVMQYDGNLVLYQGKHPLWATATSGRGVYANMQPDGNFVVYSKASRPLWAAGVNVAGSHLEVQNDGNVVVYSPSHQALWDTGTAGR
jgi:hypothetical protein